jgi:hypothetical protein
MKHALRMYWLVRGKQNYYIGDKLETESDEVGVDFEYLNWLFDTQKFATKILEEFKLKDKLGGSNMINSNIYITNQSKTILGILPINIK